MPVHLIEAYADPVREGLNLNVVVESATITVRQGTFRQGSTDYTLSADEAWAFPEAPVSGDTTFVAYLARDEGDDSVVLIVDEFGDGEPPFRFEGSGYEMLFQVWMTVVADGESNLDNSTVHVYRVSPRER